MNNPSTLRCLSVRGRNLKRQGGKYSDNTCMDGALLYGGSDHTSQSALLLFDGPMQFDSLVLVLLSNLKVPYCYYYLRVLCFANICDSEKNRKIKYPQIFLPTYQAPWYMHNHKLRDDIPFWIIHNPSLLTVSAFSFLPPRAITSSKK